MKWLTQLFSSLVGRIWNTDSTGSRGMAEWLVDWFRGEEAESGVRITGKSALKYAPVWQAVNTIAGDLATLPLLLYERDGERKSRAPEHPSYRLLRRRPNRYMSAAVFKETLQAHVLLWGNGYAEIERNPRGDAVALWPLLPDRTKPGMVDGALWYITTIDDGSERKLRAENVLHIKGLGFDGLRGYSIVAMARNSFGLGLAAEKYASKFFANDATPGGVLEHPAKLDDESFERVRDSWNDLHEGLDNKHRIAILEEGMKFQAISIPMKDAQWLEARTFQRTDVASWFCLPPHKVGDLSRATFGNIEEQNRDYLNTSLMRWLEKWAQECDEKLLREREKDADSHFFEFLTAALLRGDLLRRAQAYASGIAARWLNPNEVRAMENLNPYEGGDEFVNPHINPTNPPADPEPEPDNDEQERQATARFTELVRAEARRVTQAARTATNFTGWVASFYSRWPARVREVVAEFDGDPLHADRHCAESRDQIMVLLDRVKPAELQEEVQALVDAWHGRAHRLARDVIDSQPLKEAI